MFPRLSDIINYLFGTQMVLPAKTFGFFLALAFVAAYIPLRAELKRREALGQYKTRKEKVVLEGPVAFRDVIVHALIWGLAGYKLGLYLSEPEFFNNHTEEALMSAKGFWLTGLLGLLGGGGWKYWEYSKKKDVKLKEKEVDAGPSFYLGTVVTIAFVAGILGSKLFAMLEPGSNFWAHPIDDLLSFNGLSFFGGLICAGGLIIYYLYRKGFHVLTCVDAFAPGLILANAVGRIGCQLSGDGDWGIVNTNPKPGLLSWIPDWMWAFKYPHNVAMDGIPIQGCDPKVWDTFCRELPQPVYPTPIYETIMGVSIFAFLWMIRKKMPYPGLVTGIYMILIGIERFSIELIRVNTKYNFAGLQFTQAEFISTLLIIGGAVILFFSMKQKKQLRLV